MGYISPAVHVQALVVAVGLCAACRGGDPASPPATPTPVPIPATTEERWVVGDVAAHMATWQGGASPTVDPQPSPAPADPVYRVHVGGRDVEVRLGDYLWYPGNFVALASAPPGPAPTCTTPDILEPLLAPTVKTLTSIDREISARLVERPLDPCLHEAAAILLGAFQMREVPSYYSDSRPALNRMAAHLAIARAARGGPAPGPEGRIADLMLRAIAWRHDGFREEIAALARTARGAERTWLRAIHLYAVQDWRELSDPARATLMERIAYVMAVANKRDASRVNDALDACIREDIADWTRLVYQRGISVESCGRFGSAGLDIAQREIEEVYQAVEGRPLGDDLVAALNAESGTSRRVLDWPLWAGFEQRSLLMQAFRVHECLDETYGIPEQAAQLLEETRRRWGGLRMYPFLVAGRTRGEAHRKAMAAVPPLLIARPQEATWENWSGLADPWRGGVSVPLPDERAFFVPLLPRGTVLDYNFRLHDRRGQWSTDLALLEGAIVHSYHTRIRNIYANARYDRHPTAAALKELFGFRLGFDRDALWWTANAAEASDPAMFKEMAGGLCDLSVDDCDRLAVYLREHGEPEAAVAVYEKWVAGARDRVGVANDVEWLATYYLEKGQPKRALELGRMAAHVYSGAGLDTYGVVLEKLGRLDEAEAQFQKSHERYDNPGALVEFLVRHQDRERYRKMLADIRAEAFPGGERKVTAADILGSPPKGARVLGATGSNPVLQSGDVVVAVDGIRVENLKQLRIERRLSTVPAVTLLVFRASQVISISPPRKILADVSFEHD